MSILSKLNLLGLVLLAEISLKFRLKMADGEETIEACEQAI